VPRIASGKDEDLHGEQRAVGLRPRADADEAALLDVGDGALTTPPTA
jgi:hypothetical protein